MQQQIIQHMISTTGIAIITYSSVPSNPAAAFMAFPKTLFSSYWHSKSYQSVPSSWVMEFWACQSLYSLSSSVQHIFPSLSYSQLSPVPYVVGTSRSSWPSRSRPSAIQHGQTLNTLVKLTDSCFVTGRCASNQAQQYCINNHFFVLTCTSQTVD